MILMAIVIIMATVFVMAAMTSVVINMNLAIEVLGFSPDQGWTNSGLNGERPPIAEAPLKNATKQAIDRVVLGIALKVGFKTTMTLDGEDGSEVKFPSLKRFVTTPMGTMGLGRQSRCKGTQQQSQKQKARAEHET